MLFVWGSTANLEIFCEISQKRQKGNTTCGSLKSNMYSYTEKKRQVYF